MFSIVQLQSGKKCILKARQGGQTGSFRTLCVSIESFYKNATYLFTQSNIYLHFDTLDTFLAVVSVKKMNIPFW